MTSETEYKAMTQILKLVESESNKPLDNYNYETRIWSKGYRKAMLIIRDFIWDIINRDNTEKKSTKE
jgi:hypothetical protein